MTDTTQPHDFYSSRRKFVKSATIGTAVGLAGCLGGGENGGDHPVLELNSGIDPSSEVANQYTEALHEAGMSEDIEMEYSGIAAPGDRITTWEQWFSTNREKPDLLQIEAPGTRFIERDGLLNLSEYISDDVQRKIEDRMDIPILDMYTQEGDLYGVPWLINIGLVHYRKDLVEEAGYDPGGDDWMTNPLTWEEFNQVITDAQMESDVDYGFSMSIQDRFAGASFYEMVHSWGGDYFGGEPPDQNVQERPVTLTEEPVIRSLEMIRTFIYGSDDPRALNEYDQISSIDVLQWGEDPPVDQFRSENQVAMRSWSWPVPILQEELGEIYGTMPMPIGVPETDALHSGRGGSGLMLGGWCVAGNGNTNNPEAVGEFIEAMVTDHAQLVLFEEQGYAPPARDLYASDEIREGGVSDHADTLQYIAENAEYWPEADPLWQDHVGRFESNLHAVLRQEADLEEAMTDVEDTILHYQSNYHGSN